MITPIAVILGLVLIFGIADHYGFDPMWFLGGCLGGVGAVYIMNVLPFQLTWWVIEWLAK